jgi:hypothetical protein
MELEAKPLASLGELATAFDALDFQQYALQLMTRPFNLPLNSICLIPWSLGSFCLRALAPNSNGQSWRPSSAMEISRAEDLMMKKTPNGSHVKFCSIYHKKGLLNWIVRLPTLLSHATDLIRAKG